MLSAHPSLGFQGHTGHQESEIVRFFAHRLLQSNGLFNVSFLLLVDPYLPDPAKLVVIFKTVFDEVLLEYGGELAVIRSRFKPGILHVLQVLLKAGREPRTQLPSRYLLLGL